MAQTKLSLQLTSPIGSVLQSAPILWVLLLAVFLVPANGQANTKREQELAHIRARIATLQQSLQQERGREGDLVARLRESEREVGKVARALAEVDAQIRKQGRKLRQLRRERKEQEQLVKEQRSLLADQIRAAFAMGRQEQVKLLLNQQDPAKMGRMLVYYDYLNRARILKIELINGAIRRIQSLGDEIFEQQRLLDLSRSDQINERAQLDTRRQQRQQVLDELRDSMRSRDQELVKLRNDESRLLRLLSSLQEVVEELPLDEGATRTFAKQKGDLAWPVRGKLAARYGEQRVGGKIRWQGVVIDAGAGNQVQSISHGRVIYADWLRGFGMLIIVDHGEGYMSLYGHNQSLYKEVGEWVEPGDVIATVGDSGGQSTTGLYFEIRRHGKPINPVLWCKGSSQIG